VNAHEVLGVRPGASAHEVRVAWRRQARHTHPDCGGDAALFQRGLEAYRHLTGARRGTSPVLVAPRQTPARLALRWVRRRHQRARSPRVI